MKTLWVLMSVIQLMFAYSPQAGNIDEDNNIRTFQYSLEAGYSWKATSAGSGMYQADNRIYMSNDRGISWHKLSDSLSGTLPSGPIGDLKFKTKDTGWITIHSPRQGDIGLYKTTDGGIHWAKEQLEVPSKYASVQFNPSSPIFFTSTNYGIVLLNEIGLLNEEGQTETSLLFYATQDNGRHWTPIMDRPEGQWNGLSWKASLDQKSASYSWSITIGDRTWTSSNGEIWSMN
ncbi:hypothetical protein NSS79_25490 [Paenibacillus sp. FSL L8-0436]|uniref:WD40/YVTN/BNR-like repeat-containing protein n=1 Tax=Paenibacillus sp. FSL L8-0436 TaxID=2954686 RepID=UPI00315841F9